MTGLSAVWAVVFSLAIGQDAEPVDLPVMYDAPYVLRTEISRSVRKDAQRRMYRLNPAPLAELDVWLAGYRRLWTDKLDALEAHLNKEFPQ